MPTAIALWARGWVGVNLNCTMGYVMGGCELNWGISGYWWGCPFVFLSNLPHILTSLVKSWIGRMSKCGVLSGQFSWELWVLFKTVSLFVNPVLFENQKDGEMDFGIEKLQMMFGKLINNKSSSMGSLHSYVGIIYHTSRNYICCCCAACNTV